MKKPQQPQLAFETEPKESYTSLFKRMYFNLYTNSQSSRAETIIEDLSKILLIKLASKAKKVASLIQEFVSSEQEANELLLPSFIKLYPKIADSLNEFRLSSASIRLCFKELESVNINNAPSHIIGDAFQSLIGPTLRGDKGQFFTPKSIVSAMVEIVAPGLNDKIVDPACGTGGFLIESYNYSIRNNGGFNGAVLGIDKDTFLANTAKAICEIYSENKYEIHNANSLDITNLKQSAPNLFDADIVLTNPPFGAKIGVNDKLILKQYDLGHNWVLPKDGNKWVKTNQVKSEESPQVLFVELCINLLKEGGTLAVVLPEGLFGNKGEGYIWDYLNTKGYVLAMIDCPRTAFQPSTDVKTNILFFRKGLATNAEQPDFKVAVATNCGHDKRGKFYTTGGLSYPDDFPVISAEYRAKDSSFWKRAKVKDRYYMVPRYCQEEAVETAIRATTDYEDIYSFADLIKLKYISVKKGNEVGSEAYGTGDIPFIRTSDISNLEVTNDPTKSVGEEYFVKYNKTQGIQEHDILMVSDGRYRIGKTAMVLGENTKCVVQSHVKIIRVLPNAPFTAFELLYMMNQHYVAKQIRNLIFIQSTLGSLGSRINELQIPIPKRSEEWLEKITDFEATLRTRNALLYKIKNMQLEDVM
ncbi:N-6 DNA methylase [Hymenobacter sp. UYCo722]|uniref:N-6 DNA methylase n=1 Tax=Hymenobacter sp. UYCo722 TaxID=3156335 RepID=UPI003398589E